MRPRRFRPPFRRLPKADEALAIELDAVLETQLSGKAASVQRALLGASQRQELHDLERTIATTASWAIQDDGAWATAAQEDREKIWRHLMASTSSPTTEKQRFQSGYEVTPSQVSTRQGQPWGWVNAAMTAVLVIALAGAALFTTQRFLDGSGGGDGSNQLAQMGGTPEPYPQDVTGLAPVTMPTAADCTVKPLTIDEVIAILKEAPVLGPNYSGYAQGIYPTDNIVIRTELNAPDPVPSDQTMQQIIELRREWIACTMKSSYFQKWALEDAVMIRRQLATIIPIFASESDVRYLLSQLQENGWLPALESILQGTGEYIALVDPMPQFTEYYWEYSGSQVGEFKGICTSQIIYDWQGKPKWRWLVTQHPMVADMCFERVDRERWIVSSVPPPIYYAEPVVPQL